MNPETEMVYGVMAEFTTPEEAAHAAKLARENGFTRMDAYGPFPSPELAEAIGFHEHKVAPCVLGGGVIGGLCGYALQYYVSVIDYPHNIGGRPLDSWPSFIPITFETSVLGASVIGVVSLLVLSRLPRLAHPVFSAPRFVHATSDHFFLCLVAGASGFSADKARDFLQGLSPVSVSLLSKEKTP